MANEKRLIAVTDEQILALNAVFYGCNNNKRLNGSTYVQNIGLESEQSISFYNALCVVRNLLDELPVVKPEPVVYGQWGSLGDAKVMTT